MSTTSSANHALASPYPSITVTTLSETTATLLIYPFRTAPSTVIIMIAAAFILTTFGFITVQVMRVVAVTTIKWRILIAFPKGLEITA